MKSVIGNLSETEKVLVGLDIRLIKKGTPRKKVTSSDK